MNWHEAAPILSPLLSVILGGAVGHLTGKGSVKALLKQAEAAGENAEAAQKQAEAAKDEAEAAKEEAAAEMRKAVAAEREVISADWSRYVDAKDREIDGLRARVEHNDERLSQAEMRALADRERAERSDRLYWKAVIYLRIVIRWINDQHPDSDYPAPPVELIADL